MVITGTRTGIGRLLAEHYAQHGFEVVGCSRLPSDLDLPSYHHYLLDVADEPAVKRMLNDASHRLGRVDVLINNAGEAAMNHSLLTPMSTAQRLMHTNFSGTFLCSREAAKLMKRGQGGRIINFSSIAVPLSVEGEAVYAASKSAVETLTRILARELADYQITVNAVGLSPVKTAMIRSVPQAALSALMARQAIRRYGELRDIRNVLDFLIAAESDFITGQILYLGGV